MNLSSSFFYYTSSFLPPLAGVFLAFFSAAPGFQNVRRFFTPCSYPCGILTIDFFMTPPFFTDFPPVLPLSVCERKGDFFARHTASKQGCRKTQVLRQPCCCWKAGPGGTVTQKSAAPAASVFESSMSGLVSCGYFRRATILSSLFLKKRLNHFLSAKFATSHGLIK